MLIISTELNHSLASAMPIAYLMLSIKVESHEFKPFKDAAEDYANKYNTTSLKVKTFTCKQVLYKFS